METRGHMLDSDTPNRSAACTATTPCCSSSRSACPAMRFVRARNTRLGAERSAAGDARRRGVDARNAIARSRCTRTSSANDGSRSGFKQRSRASITRRVRCAFRMLEGARPGRDALFRRASGARGASLTKRACKLDKSIAARDHLVDVHIFLRRMQAGAAGAEQHRRNARVAEHRGIGPEARADDRAAYRRLSSAHHRPGAEARDPPAIRTPAG